MVVCSARNFPWLSKLAFKAGVKNVFTLERRPQRQPARTRGAGTATRTRRRVKRADDLAAILYTSGTTGRSKGAMLTHGNLLSNARTLHAYWGWQSSDVLIHALPMFHVHGLFVASHGALLAGAKMLWFNRFEPKATIAQLRRATVFMGVPTLYVRMLAEPALTREACSHMRLFIAGSAPLLLETFDAWRARTGHTILERYGMSETVMLTSNPYRAEDGERRAGTVGLAAARRAACASTTRRASPATAARSAASRSRARTSSRATGACPRRRPRSSRPTSGSRPATSARSTSTACVTIVGRSKDLIISGGYNVYPAEIEGYLNEQPGVAESAVIGVPHADFGEAVVAVVVAQARRRARRRGADRGAEGPHRQLQGAQAGLRRARTAAQRDGQGAEEPAARAAQRPVRCCRRPLTGARAAAAGFTAA